jgi:hypothetical protein
MNRVVRRHEAVLLVHDHAAPMRVPEADRDTDNFDRVFSAVA